MKLPVVIACLLLTANVYADQAKDSNNNPTQSEVSKAPEVVPGQPEVSGIPTWAGANSGPSADYEGGIEPSYSDADEPPFGDDRYR
jgi:hypothetical protein